MFEFGIRRDKEKRMSPLINVGLFDIFFIQYYYVIVNFVLIIAAIIGSNSFRLKLNTCLSIVSPSYSSIFAHYKLFMIIYLFVHITDTNFTY